MPGRLESVGEDRARLAVAEERTRIARELHAVVANNVSAMVVAAEAAERLLDVDRARADEAIAGIEDTGRDALSEMRRILGVLRSAGDGPELAPQPGVGQLHRLVERVRESGLSVELRVKGEPGPLPPSVDIAVYRIVQEALANAVDHAGGAPACVTVRFGEEDLEVTISDSDRAPEAERPTLAMRERAGLSGGVLRAGPVGEGYEVHAVLPRAFEDVAA
jgi:signal transduction histidine kinase